MRELIVKKTGRYLNVFAWGVLLFFAAVYFTPVSGWMAEGLRVPPLEQKADVIVVLGGGVHRNGVLTSYALERTVHGITLYHRRMADRIVFAGGNPMRYTVGPESKSMGKLAADLNVPAGAVFTEEESKTTHENATLVKKLLGDSFNGKILLVTSQTHMKRAAGAFRVEGMEVYPAPTPWKEQYLMNWDRLKLFNACVHEYLGIVWYRYKGWYKE